MGTRIHRQSGVLKAEIRHPFRKEAGRGGLLRLAALTLGLVIAGPAARSQGIRISDEIISDPQTGAALQGFDPVAYFIDSKARRGSELHQAMYGGKLWLFVSDANRSAFVSNPKSYVPAYGGYDPVGIAAGFAVSGSPEYFVIEASRIYLFRHARSREAFVADPSIQAQAERNWPQVRLDLAP